MPTTNIIYEARGDWGTCWLIQEATGKLPSCVNGRIEFRITTSPRVADAGRTGYYMQGPDGDRLPGVYVVDSVEQKRKRTVIHMSRSIEEE